MEFMKTFKFEYHSSSIEIAILPRPPSFFVPDVYRVIEDFNKQNNSSARLLRPSVADYLLTSNIWTDCLPSNPFPTDAIVAYDAPSLPLQKEIVFDDPLGTLIFPVPKEFVGHKNIVIAATDLKSQNFKKEGEHTIITDCSPVVFTDFPEKSGSWQKYDKKFILPHGKPSTTDARCLSRKTSSYVGFLSRDSELIPGVYGNGKLDVNAYTNSSDILDLIVELKSK